MNFKRAKKQDGNTSCNFDLEPEARDAIAVVRINTMVSYASLVTLFQQIRHCEINHISGDYVECGVWKGGASSLMALANLQYGKKRRNIHMFDSFQEQVEPDPAVDGEKIIANFQRRAGVSRDELQGRLRSVKGIYDDHGGPGSVEIVKDLIENKINYPGSNCFYYKGWFQETLPNVAPTLNEIAVLRLDGDMYASTKVCLEYLYEKVVIGGFIIIDDYGFTEGCKKAVDEFREKHGIKSFISHVDQDCRYWIKEV